MTLPLLTPLPVETLRAEGVPEPLTFGHADRVRFSDLDALDHVNNARYLSWFETFRVSYLRAYGMGDYGSSDRPIFVLKQVGVDYHAPLHLEQTYVVAGRTRAFRRTSYAMEYGVWCDGVLRATSHAILCLMEADFRTRRPLPQAWTDAFRDRDGALRDG